MAKCLSVIYVQGSMFNALSLKIKAESTYVQEEMVKMKAGISDVTTIKGMQVTSRGWKYQRISVALSPSREHMALPVPGF